MLINKHEPFSWLASCVFLLNHALGFEFSFAKDDKR